MYKNFELYLIFINLCGFISMYLDKRYAIKKKRRISEKNLLMIAFLGGALGTWVSMYLNNHKTSKLKFKVGVPLALIFNFLIVTIGLKVLTNV